MPCTSAVGTWNASRGCYARLTSPQPPFTDAIWKSRTDGAIYTCTFRDPTTPTGLSDTFIYYWSASGAVVPPDPKVLAQQAVALMRLRAVTVGMVPEPVAGRVGLVGMPVWLWVASPDVHSWGPATATASAGGYSVTATGQVSYVRWEMGDGGVVSCSSVGSVWTADKGKVPSPDCGYVYAQQGTYTVRATSYWVIHWSGIGQTGVINTSYTSSVVVTIGELQTVVTK